MGFVKFARVFRFIGFFVGLSILAIGLLLIFAEQIVSPEILAQSASSNEMTVETLIQTWKTEGYGLAFVGGALMLFGIVCFIVFGVKKNDLYGYSESSSYSSNTYSSYNYASEPSRTSFEKSISKKSSSASSSWSLSENDREIGEHNIETLGDRIKAAVKEAYLDAPEWIVDHDVKTRLPKTNSECSTGYWVCEVTLYVDDVSHTSNNIEKEELFDLIDTRIKEEMVFAESQKLTLIVDLEFDSSRLI